MKIAKLFITMGVVGFLGSACTSQDSSPTNPSLPSGGGSGVGSGSANPDVIDSSRRLGSININPKAQPFPILDASKFQGGKFHPLRWQCALTIKPGKVDGTNETVFFVTAGYPCGQATMTFHCSGRVCAPIGDSMQITLIDDDRLQLWVSEKLASNNPHSALYEREQPIGSHDLGCPGWNYIESSHDGLVDICDRGEIGVSISEQTGAHSCSAVSIEAMAKLKTFAYVGEGFVSTSHFPFTTICGRTFQGLSSLTRLDLTFTQVSTLAPDTFQGLSTLQTLFLMDNKISDFSPAVVSPLVAMKDFSLVEDGITALDPAVLKALPPLDSLGLKINQLEIDARLFEAQPKITTLFFGSDQMTKLNPDAFKSLQNLRELSISHTRSLKSVDAGTFRALPHLQKLELEDCDLIHIDAHAFQGLKNLKSLNLLNNKLTKIESGTLADVPALEEFDLMGNQVDTLSRSEVGLSPKAKVYGVDRVNP